MDKRYKQECGKQFDWTTWRMNFHWVCQIYTYMLFSVKTCHFVSINYVYYYDVLSNYI